MCVTWRAKRWHLTCMNDASIMAVRFCRKLPAMPIDTWFAAETCTDLNFVQKCIKCNISSKKIPVRRETPHLRRHLRRWSVFEKNYQYVSVKFRRDSWVWQMDGQTFSYQMPRLRCVANKLATLHSSVLTNVTHDEWSGSVDSSHEGTRQISSLEACCSESRRVSGHVNTAVHCMQLAASTATNSPRTDPACWRHWTTNTDHRTTTTCCHTAATQRPQQVALETVVDETVDDWIDAAVAVAML